LQLTPPTGTETIRVLTNCCQPLVATHTPYGDGNHIHIDCLTHPYRLQLIPPTGTETVQRQGLLWLPFVATHTPYGDGNMSDGSITLIGWGCNSHPLRGRKRFVDNR